MILNGNQWDHRWVSCFWTLFWPTWVFQNLELNTTAKLWPGPWRHPARPGSILHPCSAKFLQEHIWAQGLFFMAHLQCPILFLDTLSFPTDTGAQFPNGHFNKMVLKVLLSVSPRKLSFSNACSKKDGWTWHTPDSPLSVLKGQLQTPQEASSCRDMQGITRWLTAVLGKRMV